MIWDGTNNPPCPGELETIGNRIHWITKDPKQFGTISSDRSLDNIIDCKGMTLMPGLIEGHSHPSFPDSWDFDIPPEEHTLITLRGAQTLLDAGFTSLFSAASSKIRLDVAIRNEINSGRIIGPRIRAAGPEITSPGSFGDGIVRGLHESNTFGYPVVGVDGMEEAVKIMISQGVDTIKLNISGEEYTEDGNDIKTNLSREQVAAAVKLCHAKGVLVAGHCRGAESVEIAITEGLDIIYHCDYASDETIELLVKAKDRIFLGPGIGLMDRTDDKKCQVQSVTYKKIRKLAPDMRIVIGGDYGLPKNPQGTNCHDLLCFVKYFGYSPIEALMAATSVGGEIMQMEVGKLQEGYFADMILVDGKPTENLGVLMDKKNIKLIVLNGWLYKDAR
jgi:imidazolonepropionase-like amidohydrolase